VAEGRTLCVLASMGGVCSVRCKADMCDSSKDQRNHDITLDMPAGNRQIF
jgi:hypothetical protein